jgi:D-cysteine desulfhydrase
MSGRPSAGPLPWLSGPTPVRPVTLDGRALWVKDEGQAGVTYGGNKVRKLAWLLADAVETGITDVVTVGAIGSHHVLATALHAETLGIRTHAVLFPQPETAHVRHVAERIDAACATVRRVPGFSRGALAGAAQVARVRRDTGRMPRILPAGGSNALGTLGWLHAGLELAEQVRGGELPAPRRIYVPLGTGGTAAGLAAGLALAGIDAELVAVRVVSRAVANGPAIERLAHGALALYGAEARLGPIRISSDQYAGGYGRFDEAITRAVALGRDAGLPLETTYSGKALAACLAEHDGADVLFVQTASAR